MSTKTCVIPISVSGQRFRTQVFRPALQAITTDYDRAVFLVADTLQIYNKAAMATSVFELREVIESFNERKGYLQERRIWLTRLQTELVDFPIGRAKWDILGVDDCASTELSLIFRAITMLFSINESFFNLIMKDADSHIVSNGSKGTQEQRRRLSVLYLLEELSLNTYLHCVKGIGDEYYIDGALPCLRAIYSGDFGITGKEIVQLLGIQLNAPSFEFYTFDDKNNVWHALQNRGREEKTVDTDFDTL